MVDDLINKNTIFDESRSVSEGLKSPSFYNVQIKNDLNVQGRINIDADIAGQSAWQLKRNNQNVVEFISPTGIPGVMQVKAGDEGATAASFHIVTNAAGVFLEGDVVFQQKVYMDGDLKVTGSINSGASGSFTTTDLKTVTVVGGIITAIV